MLLGGQFLLVVFFPGYETLFFGGAIIFVKSYPFYFILNFLFHVGVEPMNSVIVSGGQHRDSAIHTHVSVLPQTPLPSRLPHNIEQSSMFHLYIFFDIGWLKYFAHF